MGWLGDLRFALRGMGKNPGFTAVAVIALALGIGVNATVFAIVDAVLIKRMPFITDRVLFLNTKNLNRPDRDLGVSWPDFRDWREQSKTFRAFGAWDFNLVNVSDKTGVPARYSISSVTANTFSILGLSPAIGRDFTAEDEKPGAAPVVILGYGLWEDRYGKDPAILGQSIRVNEVPRLVIGVMPNGMRFPEDSDGWIPLIPDQHAEERQNRSIQLFAGLAPGATKESSRAELESISHNLEKAYPDTNAGMIAEVRDFNEAFLGRQIRLLMYALMGAVIFVLLIACANVANLQLGRAVERAREISIRIAIGAGRWRVIRQLLVESVVLSAAGGVLGWLVSIWGIRAFAATVRGQAPVWIDFSMDYRGFLYLAAISLGTGLLFGLAPALRLSRMDVNASLKEGGRGSSSGRGKFVSGVLVIAEMALAVVLLAGAGLMIRSFLKVYTTQPGINPKNLLVMRLLLPAAKYPKPADQIAFHERLKPRLDAIAGVDVTTIATTMPTGGSQRLPYELEGAPVDEKTRPRISLVVIGPDYFRAMDVKLLRGRTFTETDGGVGPPVAIVNQRMAEKFWPGDDPAGKRLRLFRGKTPEPWLTVIGVAPNILQNDRTVTDFDPLIYVPFRQRPSEDVAVMARTRVPPGTLATAFRREVQAIDENLPVYNLRTMEERLAQNYWDQQVFGGLFAIFAGIALVLASVGLYAVIAHSVSQRTEEIGVRMALGASGQKILAMIFAQGMRQLGIGLAVGLAAALALTRALQSVLVHTSAADPATFVAVTLVLSLAAVAGCLIPARRAMRVDPVIALRHE